MRGKKVKKEGDRKGKRERARREREIEGKEGESEEREEDRKGKRERARRERPGGDGGRK